MLYGVRDTYSDLLISNIINYNNIKSDVKRHFSNIYDRLSHLIVEYSILYISYRKILLEESRKRMTILSISIRIPLRHCNNPWSSTAPESRERINKKKLIY